MTQPIQPVVRHHLRTALDILGVRLREVHEAADAPDDGALDAARASLQGIIPLEVAWAQELLHAPGGVDEGTADLLARFVVQLGLMGEAVDGLGGPTTGPAARGALEVATAGLRALDDETKEP